MGYGTACQPGAPPKACGHITKEKAWDYIEQAAKLCSFRSSYSGRNRQEFPFRKSDEIGKR